MDGLKVAGLDAGYGRLQVLRGVSVEARPGKVTVVLGHNGAGKSTLLKTVAGVIRPSAGQVTLSGRGVATGDFAMVPQGLGIFPRLTVGENIRLGLVSAGVARDKAAERVEETAGFLPILKDRWHERAGSLSGGQRQIVSIGRALVTGADLLLLDEPSVGLAPRLVEDMMALFGNLRAQGKCVVLVEQNVAQALTIADDYVVLKSGRVISAGQASELPSVSEMWSLF